MVINPSTRGERTLRRIKKVSAVSALALLTATPLLPSTAGATHGPVRASADYKYETPPNNLPARGKAGPNLAVNPDNPQQIAVLNQELVTEQCEVNRSTDGGNTWSAPQVLRAPVGPTPSNPTGTPAYPTSSPGPCDVTGHGSSNVGKQSIGWGSGNNVYAVWTATRTLTTGGGWSVLLSKSTDGGATWPPAVEVTSLVGGPAPALSYNFPELGVDRRGAGTDDDRLYIATRESRQSRAVVVRSDDSGNTWSASAEASDNNPATSPAPVFNAGGTAVTTAGNAFRSPGEVSAPVLGPPGANGNRPVYISYVAGKASGTCPPNCEQLGQNSTDSYIYVARSLDNGATWTRSRAINVRGFNSPAASLFGGSHFPRLAAGPGGEVYMTFNQGPGTTESSDCGTGPFPAGAPGAAGTRPCPSYGAGSQFQSADHFMNWDLDVWFMRSTDQGTSFSDLKQLNDPKKPGLAVPEITQTRHPNILVAPNGRVDITWHDRRHWYLNTSDRLNATKSNTSLNPSATALANYACVHSHSPCPEARLGDTYYSHSSDNGLTFAPNRRLSDRSHNNDVGFDYRFSTHWDYGPQIAYSGNEQLLVADMDSRLGSADTDTQDFFMRKVQLNASDTPEVETFVAAGGASEFSVNLSRRVLPGGGEAVHGDGFTNRPWSRPVIVNETDPAAALVGSVLARANLGPVLASPAAGLPTAAASEVRRLNPVGAYILGDTTKLGSGMEGQLATATGAPAGEIKRLNGATPAALAAQVALELDRRRPPDKAGAPPLPAFDAVIITNPNSASAASASALAANRRLPILFTEQNSIPTATRDALAALNITKTIIVGSTGLVSDAVAGNLPNATRLTGESGGYRLVGAGGAVYTFGNAGNFGDLNGVALDQPIVGSATTPSGNGYWMVASDGGIFAFGDARFFGSTGGIRLDRPIVGMASTPSGNGYWLVASDGGIFAYGDARFFGSTGGMRLDQPIVGMAPTPSGNGYWLVASDGGIFAYGDARFFGSTGGIPLDKPVVGMASTASGNGYWLVASDGGIFAFGDAVFTGSTGGIPLDRPVIGMTASPTGRGYNLVASDGGIFSFGDAQFFGSVGGTAIPAPVVGSSTSNRTASNQFSTSTAVVNESVARGLPRNVVYVADGNEPMHGALLGWAVARMGGLLVLTSGGTASGVSSSVPANQTDRLRTSDLTSTASVQPDRA